MARLPLNRLNASVIRQRAHEGELRGLRGIECSGLTLSGLCQLASAYMGSLHAQPGVAEELYRVGAVSRQFREVVRFLSHGVPVGGERVEGVDPCCELYSLAERNDILGTRWELFLMRFEQMLKRFGFVKAGAIASALMEMADNVIQHSGEAAERSARGIVGYHVEAGWMAFAVADLGRGVLSSLRRNARWQGLSGSAEALRAVVLNRATSRIDQEEGGGFRQLQAAILDKLRGQLFFQSGDASLEVRPGGPVEIIERNAAPLLGFRVEVSCNLSGLGEERLIPS